MQPSVLPIILENRNTHMLTTPNILKQLYCTSLPLVLPTPHQLFGTDAKKHRFEDAKALLFLAINAFQKTSKQEKNPPNSPKKGPLKSAEIFGLRNLQWMMNLGSPFLGILMIIWRIQMHLGWSSGQIWTLSLKLTYSSTWKWVSPIGKQYSKHPFLGAMLVSGRVWEFYGNFFMSHMLVFWVGILQGFFLPGKLLAKHVGIFPTFVCCLFQVLGMSFFMRGMMYLCVNSLKPDEFAVWICLWAFFWDPENPSISLG